MLNSENIVGSVISLGGFLSLLFSILRLVGVTSWSWVWILSPLLIAVGLIGLGILLIIFVTVPKTNYLCRGRR